MQRNILLPNKINAIAVIITLVIVHVLRFRFHCTGLYHMVDGYPIAPFTASEIPISCIGNHISSNLWIYPVTAIMSYVLSSILAAPHKKK